MTEHIEFTWKAAAFIVGGLLSAVAGYAAVDLTDQVKSNTALSIENEKSIIRMEGKLDQILEVLERK